MCSGVQENKCLPCCHEEAHKHQEYPDEICVFLKSPMLYVLASHMRINLVHSIKVKINK